MRHTASMSLNVIFDYVSQTYLCIDGNFIDMFSSDLSDDAAGFPHRFQ